MKKAKKLNKKEIVNEMAKVIEDFNMYKEVFVDEYDPDNYDFFGNLRDEDELRNFYLNRGFERLNDLYKMMQNSIANDK